MDTSKKLYIIHSWSKTYCSTCDDDYWGGHECEKTDELVYHKITFSYDEKEASEEIKPYIKCKIELYGVCRKDDREREKIHILPTIESDKTIYWESSARYHGSSTTVLDEFEFTFSENDSDVELFRSHIDHLMEGIMPSSTIAPHFTDAKLKSMISSVKASLATKDKSVMTKKKQEYQEALLEKMQDDIKDEKRKLEAEILKQIRNPGGKVHLKVAQPIAATIANAIIQIEIYDRFGDIKKDNPHMSQRKAKSLRRR
jgi:hypothetical protein